MDYETYMHRCIALAKLGAGNVAPNPMVGAVLVYNDIIIGEGFHQHYGQSHAEVNCINSVENFNLDLIEKATLYVSLEPCAHFGKTPPCADLIIQYKIKNVVIACRDSFEAVDGKGIEKLKAAGIHVTIGVLENEALELNKRFFTFHSKRRPYIILKWAQTNNNKIAHSGNERLLISNEISNRAVHKWRTEEAAILVGTNTAMQDNPSLTARFWQGKNPVRLVIDTALKLPNHLHLLDDQVKTIIFNYQKESQHNNTFYCKVFNDKSLIAQIADRLFQLNINSVLVEGGAQVLQSFINENYWDEARVITNIDLQIEVGIEAPQLANSVPVSTQKILADRIDHYKNLQSL